MNTKFIEDSPFRRAELMRRVQALRRYWPAKLRGIIKTVSALANEFNLAGGKAGLTELRSHGVEGVRINFTHLPGHRILPKEQYVSVHSYYSTGSVIVETGQGVRSNLTADDLPALSVAQLILDEVGWSSQKKSERDERGGNKTTNKVTREVT